MPSRESASETPEELAGPRYALGEQFSKGGKGGLWYARESATGRTIALKRILGRPDAAAFRRFLNEAKITARLEHPNIVPVHGLGTDPDGHPFYTMKLVQGTDLAGVLAKLADGDREAIARYPLAQLLIIFQKVCDAVAFAHSREVIHRDLKPANLMLGPFGEVLVMDWGIAKDLSEPKAATADDPPAASPDPPKPSSGGEGTTVARPASTSDDAGATLPGQAVGSAHYMAPEQARGDIHLQDARTDIYTLGAILYQILALRRPVSGTTVGSILARVKSGDLDPLILSRHERAEEDADLPAELRRPKIPRPELRHLPGGVMPASLIAVVRRAMALDPAGRYQSVPALQREITAYQNGFATSAENAGIFKLMALLVRRNKGVAATALAAWLVIAALAVWFVVKVTASEGRALESARLATTRANEVEAEKKNVEAQKLLAQAGEQAAQAAEMTAQAATVKAVASQKDADELIHYMQYDLSDTLGKLGKLKMMKGINQRIVDYHERHPPKAGDDAALREKGVSLEQQGDIFFDQGLLDDAIKSYRDSLQIRQHLARNEPVVLRQHELATGLVKFGDVLRDQGHFDAALKSYINSLEIAQDLTQKDPDNAGSQRHLAMGFVKVGDIQYAQGQIPEALKSYRDSLTIRRLLARKYPDDVRWQRDLSMGYDRVGNVLREQGQSSDALQSYRDSLQINQRLAEQDANDASLQFDLSVGFEKIGILLLRQGKPVEARSQLQQSCEIADRLGKAEPANYPVQTLRANDRHLLSLCADLKQTAQREEALGLLREAVDILKALEKSPGLQRIHARWLGNFRVLLNRKSDDPTKPWNLVADVQSLATDHDQKLEEISGGPYRSLAGSPYVSSADFSKYATKLRESAVLKMEPQIVVPTNSRTLGVSGKYPWKTRVVTTVFWVGQKAGEDNPSHKRSAWDRDWQESFGGLDDPNPAARRGYIPVGFIPSQNPFYAALPYNDVANGATKSEAKLVIPWFKEAFVEEGKSVCRDRWMVIRNSDTNKVCYAQWSDCGPFRSDHWQYVFGPEKPKPNANQGAGLDISPAVRDYLGLGKTDVTDWKFIDFREVPTGPWAQFGDNNDFVKNGRRNGQRESGAREAPLPASDVGPSIIIK